MNEHYPFANPPLPYTYDALEPYVNIQTLYQHHNRILQQYVTNLNNILKDYPELQTLSLEELLTSAENLPPEIRQSVIDRAGGIYNHMIYFYGMANPSAYFQTVYLSPAIIRDFGTGENFFNEYKKYAMSIFGPGYAWLVADSDGKLRFITTSYEDSPILYNLCIVAGIDVWEHSYYAPYFTSRSAYIEDWFHVLNWEIMERRYKNCINVE
ncbi:MAG: superoxide dismutase [Hungatella sp.]|nr:superoxide dismutase [Hungatella sp.]